MGRSLAIAEGQLDALQRGWLFVAPVSRGPFGLSEGHSAETSGYSAPPGPKKGAGPLFWLASIPFSPEVRNKLRNFREPA
jgi:hypothetical protein